MTQVDTGRPGELKESPSLKRLNPTSIFPFNLSNSFPRGRAKLKNFMFFVHIELLIIYIDLQCKCNLQVSEQQHFAVVSPSPLVHELR